MAKDKAGATNEPGGGAARPGPAAGERPAHGLIGAALFEARMAAGLTAAQVGQSTRISPELLRRMEAGQFEACGGDVYARGHIRAAALAVDLDPEPLLAWYGAIRLPPLTRRDLRKPRVLEPASPTGRARPRSGAERARSVLPSIVPGVVPSLVPMAGQTPPPELPPLRRARRDDFTDADAGTAATLGMVDREPGRGPVRDKRPAAFLAGDKEQRRAGPNWSLALLGALGAFGLVAAVQLWPQSALSPSGAQDSAHTVKAPAQPVGAAAAQTAAPAPAAAAPAPAPAVPPTPKPTAPVVVQITTKVADSWVGVTNAAGDHLFWSVQAAGQTQRFTDNSQLSVTVGNAAAVDLTVNGHELGVPGPAGQVYQATYGPQN